MAKVYCVFRNEPDKDSGSLIKIFTTRESANAYCKNENSLLDGFDAAYEYYYFVETTLEN